MSFTSISYQSLGLRDAIDQELDRIARLHQLELQTRGIGARFRELIDRISVSGKVVVLIDEYDAPIINYLGTDTAKSIENRDVLREMYTVLKDADAAIELVFLTGVSKFSKTGISLLRAPAPHVSRSRRPGKIRT